MAIQRQWYGANLQMTHFLWSALILTLLFIMGVMALLYYQLRKRVMRDRLQRHRSTGVSRDLNLKVSRFSFAGLASYIIATLIFLIAEVCHNSYSWSGYPYAFICITWGTANIFAYLLYIERLHVSFGNTIYATADRVFYLFYVLIALFMCSQCLETLINVGYTLNAVSVGTAQSIFIASFGFDMLIDGIMSITLLVIFIKKLFAVTIDSLDHDEMSSRNAARKRSSISLGSNELKYVNLVTKQFVLSTYAIVSTQIYIFWNSFSGIVYSNTVWQWDEDTCYGLYVICVLLFCNDCIANTIAVYLNFAFNDEWYGRCCKCCDECCGSCCHSLAKRRAKQQFKSMDYIQLQMSADLSGPTYSLDTMSSR